MTEAAIHTPPPVTGYRKLTQAEVDLANEIKAKVNELGNLIARMRADPTLDQRCVSIGATEIQTGAMWLSRAVFRPESFA